MRSTSLESEQKHIAHGYDSVPEIPLAAQPQILAFHPANHGQLMLGSLAHVRPHSPHPSATKHIFPLAFATDKIQGQAGV